MSKQQARLMGFALLMSFAALRAMAMSLPLDQKRITTQHKHSLLLNTGSRKDLL